MNLQVRNQSFGASKSGMLRVLLSEESMKPQPLVLGIRHSLIDEFESYAKQPSIAIGIGGMSASGKTTMADALVSAVKRVFGDKSVSEVNADKYFRDQSEAIQRAGGFKEFLDSGGSFDVPGAVNLPLLREHIEALKKGIPVKSPEYLKNGTGVSIPDRNQVEPARGIISTGIFNLHPDVAEAFDVRGYVVAPHEVVRQRWITRTGGDNPFHLDELMRRAKTNVEPTIAQANIVLNGQTPIERMQAFFQNMMEIIRGK